MNITELWKKKSDFVLCVCLRFVKDTAIAEDIRQEVFLKIISSKKSFNRESDIKTWLYSITYRCCVDYFREEKKQKEMVNEYFIHEKNYVMDVESPVWRVNDLFDMPCPISQLMVELYFEEGWSQEEIGKIFGYSSASIGKKIQMGLDNLQIF